MSDLPRSTFSTERAIVYRDRACEFSKLADYELSTGLKARYLQQAQAWHDLAVIAEQSLSRLAASQPRLCDVAKAKWWRPWGRGV